MPLYQMILHAKSYSTPQTLASLVRNCASEIIGSGGVVRCVENVGVRKLPHRFKAKFEDKRGIRYHEEARLLSFRFDASPTVLTSLERLIRFETDILRCNTVRPVEITKKANITKLKNNPFHVSNRNPVLR
ncbi:hypothetical protein TrVE_jg5160 [Triparma verrucosa]|uniref:Ribosomal protein S6 n=2 Tax=Triparma TaxID=722752 RepID=A0A9W7B6R6_9STRA|nr:hypothetical protein TrST_g1952 [Triparma strigata]GMH84433.1 hypothetical protein TrVE_jg5160 [Triparma verrucosa]|mmetsp:Transcript_14289/g.26283  ORF Transcript_14289/g.26283 Transcript_14289/m.26283 type:complete len:131 (-) Transcript_14289:37-429(-)